MPTFDDCLEQWSTADPSYCDRFDRAVAELRQEIDGVPLRPYPYRTRPAQRAWSAREAAWTRREQYNSRVISEPPEPNRKQKRLLVTDVRQQRRRSLRAASRAQRRFAGDPRVPGFDAPSVIERRMITETLKAAA